MTDAHGNSTTSSGREHTQLLLSVYIITFITGMPANIIALYTFSLKVRNKPAPIDILLLNLTVSDLVFLLFLPFRMIEATSGMRWVLPYFLCPLSGFVFYSTIYISTCFLTAVSVERYLGVAFPIKYKLKRKPIYAIVASVVFWIVSSANCSIVYIMQYHNSNSTIDTSVCYENFNKEQLKILLPVRLELFLILFCIPFLITMYSYVNFIRILNSLPNISRRRKQRANGLAMGTLLVFILCFGPYNISHVVGFVEGQSPKWRVDALLLSTFNACLDPIIFYFSSTAVQKVFGQCFKGIFDKMCKVTSCSRFMSHPSSSMERTESTSNTL
ncbi:free fatty acid receptor 2-like [Erpetoichthys calabaricus]|uniref:free fatty acid receptor 2-like n=1 Tax=Erpetoichthys calabaricus TaxID=27687 RepID=UPI0022342AAC|nr:free fatty acid receptor 2-like [Erpetoichthys calabaricus]